MDGTGKLISREVPWQSPDRELGRYQSFHGLVYNLSTGVGWGDGKLIQVDSRGLLAR